MKTLDLNQVIKTIKGAAFKENETQQELTLKSACVASLMLNEDIKAEEKYKRFQLALKLENALVPIDLTAEEISKLKELVGKAYGTAVMGAVWDLLENS